MRRHVRVLLLLAGCCFTAVPMAWGLAVVTPDATPEDCDFLCFDPVDLVLLQVTYVCILVALVAFCVALLKGPAEAVALGLVVVGAFVLHTEGPNLGRYGWWAANGLAVGTAGWAMWAWRPARFPRTMRGVAVAACFGVLASIFLVSPPPGLPKGLDGVPATIAIASSAVAAATWCFLAAAGRSAPEPFASADPRPPPPAAGDQTVHEQVQPSPPEQSRQPIERAVGVASPTHAEVRAKVDRALLRHQRW